MDLPELRLLLRHRLVLGQRALFLNWQRECTWNRLCKSRNKLFTAKICFNKQLFPVLMLSVLVLFSHSVFLDFISELWRSSGGALEELQQERRIFSKPWDRPVHVIRERAFLSLFVYNLGTNGHKVNKYSSRKQSGGGRRWVTAIRAVNVPSDLFRPFT